ncbi:ABC transporter [Glutamicibacter sp. MNS18]|uniref:ABC transporter n=1 Tax=Glutamicibacter sp. MNS18 TaxID=2989817 RepID=UPI0022358D18|nr:ABC transporter [Glutamicibacter sp. MNS18]MCW4465624.1 ABC transporter [Glutamicibacter sp. MNS18]
MNRALTGLLATSVSLLVLTSCAQNAPGNEPSTTLSGNGEQHESHDHEPEPEHGVQETSEAPLHLVSIDSQGRVGMLDLVSEEGRELGQIPVPHNVDSDGRYVFADTGAGVQVIDSGMWSWAHGDHFHYYRGTPGLLGNLEGSGPAIVSISAHSTSGGTGVFFPETGQATVLDNKELSHGRLQEVFSIQLEENQTLLSPFGKGALVSRTDNDGQVTGVRYVDEEGVPVADSEADCPQAHGSITTAAGVVLGCADGALVATGTGETPEFEKIPYPERVPAAERAMDFAGRKARPSVAALAGEHGAWILDARAKSWERIWQGRTLLRVIAVDDAKGHVIALDDAGRLRIHQLESGEETAVSEPLLAHLVDDPQLLQGVELSVDQSRAYLNDPASGTVHEIDFADSGRITRSLDTPTDAVFMAETGR